MTQKPRGKISFDEDGLRGTALPCLRLRGIIDQRVVARARRRLVAPSSILLAGPVFCDLLGVEAFTPQGRNSFTELLADSAVTALAVCCASLRTRAVMGMVCHAVNVLRPGLPLTFKLFSESERDMVLATSWLSEERERGDAMAAAREVLASQPFIPWRGPRHDGGAALDVHARSWLSAHGVANQTMRERDLGSSSASLYGRADGATLELITDVVAFFSLNAQFVESASSAKRALEGFIAVLCDDETSTPSASPATAALSDLASRLKAHASEWWLSRFRSSVRRYLRAGVLEEIDAVVRKEPPSISWYFGVRMDSSLVHVLIDLFELASGSTLKPEWVDDMVVAEVRRLTVFITVLAHDFATLLEEQRGDSQRNIIRLLITNQGRTPEEAVRAVVDAHAELSDEFELAATTLALRDRELRAYVDDCRRLVAIASSWIDASSSSAPATIVAARHLEP